MLSTLAVAALADVVVFPTGLVSLAVVFFVIALLAYVLGARGWQALPPVSGGPYCLCFSCWRC